MESLLTPSDLAQALGLSIQTIYNRHSLGQSLPPCIKMGKLLRFRSQDVERWLSSLYEVKHATPIEPSPLIRRRGRPTKAEEILRRSQKAG